MNLWNICIQGFVTFWYATSYGFKYICLNLLGQGEWTRNSRFVAPNLRGSIAPSRFGCDESTCFASILRLKMHSDMQLALFFLQLIQMHMKTHCFQCISSKEDILSLKIHSLLALNLYLCSTRYCPMHGVCIVRTSKWLDIIW